MNKNERKLKILEILFKAGKLLSSREIHDKMEDNVSIECVRALLLRYFGFGYVHREKDNGICVYSLNKTGKKKLNYLKTHYFFS